jgi:hypothetical protein
LHGFEIFWANGHRSLDFTGMQGAPDVKEQINLNPIARTPEPGVWTKAPM